MTSLVAALPRSASSARSAIRGAAFGAAVVASGILFGLLAGDLARSGHHKEVFALAGVLLPVALWKRPQLGPVVLLSAALLIEQVQNSPSSGNPAAGTVELTAHIPITANIPLFSGIGSVHLQPADVLLLMVGIIYLAKTDATTRCWPRSHVSRAIAALLGMVAIGIVVGLMHHGSLRVALMETRPYIYLGGTYVLTTVLVRSRRAMRAILWTFVVVTALKALQCLYVYLEVRHWRPRPDSMIGHEPAYFFAVYLFLVAGLWLCRTPGTLRKTATWLLPVVLGADLVNNRRAAWLLLGGGFIALTVVAYTCLPDRRYTLRLILIGLVAFSAIYFPTYWNKSGTLAQPATAIRSQFKPDARDASSDRYRTQENKNLILNIRQGGLLGKGFGVPIDYALPIVNIRAIDPNIVYVPHNGVLYVLMRMGLLGAIAFWALIGTAIVAGCRLARSVDREIAVIGLVIVAALVAYALEGATDQGFFFYRIAFVTGTLLGLAEAARRLPRAARPAIRVRSVE